MLVKFFTIYCLTVCVLLYDIGNQLKAHHILSDTTNSIAPSVHRRPYTKSLPESYLLRLVGNVLGMRRRRWWQRYDYAPYLRSC